MQGSRLCLVSGTVLKHYRKLILFCTSCFPPTIEERNGQASRGEGVPFTEKKNSPNGEKCALQKNKLINTVGESLGVINHRPALSLLAGSWLLAL